VSSGGTTFEQPIAEIHDVSSIQYELNKLGIIICYVICMVYNCETLTMKVEYLERLYGRMERMMCMVDV